MRKVYGWAAAGVLTAVVTGLAFAAPGADPEKPAPPATAPDKPAKDKDKPKDKPKERPTTLSGRIAAETKVSEEDVAKVLAALGPTVRDQLAHGDKVELPGLGAFRVVRVPEHRDLVDGRPATIAASNYIDFRPVGSVVDAANAPDAVPQTTVQPFEFNPLPGQTPSLHVPDERMPNVRTR